MNSSNNNNSPRDIILYLQVHQPKRLRIFQYLDAGGQKGYFDDDLNEMIVKGATQDCYIPLNTMLTRLLQFNRNLKVCLSIPGATLDLLQKHAPDGLQSFVDLVETGKVEILGETYYHSLASLLSEEEFHFQSAAQSERIHTLFGVKPNVFANTELIFSDHIGSMIASMGFGGAICEGVNEQAQSIQGQVFCHPHSELKIISRNVALSEDISKRFGAGESELTVDAFMSSLAAHDEPVTLLGLNYEVFAEHGRTNDAMITFLHQLLTMLSADERYNVVSVTEALSLNASTGSNSSISIAEPTSWGVETKDVSAWLGNDMQQEAFEILNAQADKIRQIGDEAFIDVWRNLQNCDHFYYMATGKKKASLHQEPLAPYPSPYEAFINYMNALSDFALNLQTAPAKEDDDQHSKALEYERQHPKMPLWAMQKESQQKLARELRV